MLYDGQRLHECIDVALLSTSTRTRQEWNNSRAVLDALPVNIHLLLLSDTERDNRFIYRIYNLPALEGTMVQCAIRFTPRMITDALLQITRGLRFMHNKGIIHQNLNPSVLWVTRSNQFVCGHRIVIGGFEKSGKRVLGQSPLNPNIPLPDWDIQALYDMGKIWNATNWPRKYSLCEYEGWLWMQPIENYLQPSSLLMTVLCIYKDFGDIAKRLHYVYTCSKLGYRLLGEPEVTTPCIEADILAIAVHIYKNAEKSSKRKAAFLYQSVIELLSLVMWETPEIKDIYELKTFIEQKIAET